MAKRNAMLFETSIRLLRFRVCARLVKDWVPVWHVVLQLCVLAIAPIVDR